MDATVRGCKKGIEIIENGMKEGSLIRDQKEDIWLDNIKSELFNVPDNENELIEEVMPTIENNKLILTEYGL